MTAMTRSYPGLAVDRGIPRRDALRLTMALLLPSGLIGCTGLGSMLNVTLPRAELQALLEREFPHRRRIINLVDVDIAKPSLRLLPERNRIATDLELSATERLSGLTARGSMALDYGLRYEPTDASVRLTQVSVQDLQLDLAGNLLSGVGARLGVLLAERLLDDLSLYRADPRRAAMLQRAGITAATIEVTPSGVNVRFDEPR